MTFEHLPIEVLVEYRSTLIGDLFPGLRRHSTRGIDWHLLDERSINTLRRRGCLTWGDLQEHTVGDLWRVPSAGRLTIGRILSAAKKQALLEQSSVGLMPPFDQGTSVGAPQPLWVEPEFDGVRAAARMIQDWAADTHGAVSVGELLDAIERPAPADVAAAIAAVRQVAFADLLPGSTSRDNSGLIIEFLGALGPDAQLLIERHISRPAGRTPTLDAVGEGRSVTRERVRQIVKRGLERAERLRLEDRFRLLRWRADEIRCQLGAACPSGLSAVSEAIDRASRGFDDPDQCTAREFVLWFAGGYREVNGWWIASTTGRLEAIENAMRSAIDSEWLLPRHKLLEVAANTGVSTHIDDEALASLSRWRSIGEGWWTRWDGSLGDKAERVLRLSLRALRPDEVNDLIGEGHAHSSVQNVLSSDSRFTRVAMDLKFGLAEWGWEEYSNAAQEITERIERSGGEALLEDIVVELFNQFGLKESTVRSYAASPAFIVAEGRIRLRGEDEVVHVNDRIASAPGLYLAIDGVVIYHARVDADLLRGSGRSIPSPLAVALGVRPGGTREFATGTGGRLRVVWQRTSTAGATIGSMRAIAERDGAKLGDVLRLAFDLELETVCGSRVTGTDLQSRTGLTFEAGGEVAALAAALNVPPAEVRSALTERGDGAIAALIPAPRSAPGLDDALKRLDGLLG
jgi:hypothetical protein